MRREIVGGVVGLGLFAGATAASIPLGVAAAAGVLGYIGGWLLMPAKQDRSLEILDAGINRAQLDDYLARLRQSAAELRELADRIDEHGMRERVQALQGITLRIIDTVAKDPRDIRNEPALPMWSEKIVERIDSYAELADATRNTGQGAKNLADCQRMVERAVSAFEQIHRDMLDDDMTELSAGSNALRDMFESKIRKDQEATP